MLTIDQIKKDAIFLADATVFNKLRKEFKEHGFIMQRNKDVHSNGLYYEGRDVQHITIDKIPMYYKKIGNTGSGIKFHLDMIKGEMRDLYDFLFSIFKQTSGPEFETVEGLVEWFHEYLPHLYNNKKLKDVAKIGVFEKFDAENLANIRTMATRRANKLFGPNKSFLKARLFFQENFSKELARYNLHVEFTTPVDVKANQKFIINGIPMHFSENKFIKFDFNEFTKDLYDRIGKELDVVIEYFAYGGIRSVKEIVPYRFETAKELQKFLIEKIPAFARGKLKKLDDKTGVFEKLKSFNDFNK